jgi:anti-sigma B factor antagonist
LSRIYLLQFEEAKERVVMELSVSERKPAHVVSVVGSLDALTSADFSSFMSEQIQQGKNRLVMDLGQVDYMSSAGLRAILAVLKEARQLGGDLRLAAAQPGVEKILTLSGFMSILKFYTSIEEAITSFA